MEVTTRIRDGFGLGVAISIGWMCGTAFITSVGQLVDSLGWFHSMGRDATDSDTKRSNLALRIDYGTGCHYLVTFQGAITPRLDTDGSPVCTPKADK